MPVRAFENEIVWWKVRGFVSGNPPTLRQSCGCPAAYSASPSGTTEYVSPWQSSIQISEPVTGSEEKLPSKLPPEPNT
ncbi:hypothetical protein [Leifsonia xyli]|uniref:hypothetical protein n=1 Tax=Leifsonia xyli TaxID=1575 RepID=UPI003D669839